MITASRMSSVRLYTAFATGLKRASTTSMIGAALALVMIGVILLFLYPWAGLVIGAVGVLLMVLFLVGFGRRTETGRP